MTTELTKLDGVIRENYAKKIMSSNKVQKFVTYLSSLAGAKSELETDIAFDVNIDGKHNLIVQLKNEDDSVRLHFQENPKRIFGHAIVQEGSKKIGKIFEDRDNNFELVKEFDYNEQFIASLNEMKNYTIPESKDFSSQAAPCVHGNWCGPLCSGPEAPETEVDSCCMQHDLCYGDEQYFDCGCDAQLQYCLAPYVQRGSQWALLVFSYFDLQPCR